jgi:dTDP-4-dehydrorhamnose 3,5-epimerase
MIFQPLPLAGAYRVELQAVGDERGAFIRRFCADTFRQHGLEGDLLQRSISCSRKAGTLRGMHFQAPPHLETKLVRCSRGAIYDVMIDLRADSPTHGKWHGEELTAENRRMLYIPKGFAHGFQTLVDDTEVDYEISPAYVAGAERGFRFDDPSLGIAWPVPVAAISDRDLSLPPSHQDIRL